MKVLFILLSLAALCTFNLGFAEESSAPQQTSEAQAPKVENYSGKVTSVDKTANKLSLELDKSAGSKTFEVDAKFLENLKVGDTVSVSTKDGKVTSVAVTSEKKAETEAEKKQ